MVVKNSERDLFLKEDLAEDMMAKGEYIPAVIYVNGMRQYSASNRKYVSPKI